MTNDTAFYVADNTRFIASDLGDEMILMNLETGDYIGLNATSAEIWKQSEKGATASQIVDHLLQQYEVDEEVCRTETESCISDMLQKELLIKK